MTMTNRRLYLMLILAAFFLAGSYAIQAATSGLRLPWVETIVGPGEPPIPDVMAPAEQVDFWSGRLSPDTQDYITLTHLGRAYLLLARETGDAAAYTRAEEALQQALTLNPRYEPAKGLIGSVLIGQHEFAAALDHAKTALATNPDEYQALAVVGDASLELGRYGEADAAYRRLLDAAPGGPVYSRMARLSWLMGQPDEAIDWMRRAADEAVALDLGGEELAWYRFQLGELYFHRGDLRAARRWYDEADEALPGYYLAQAGLGKVAAARGDLTEAITVYESLVARLPQPSFVAFLGDLYALNGDNAAAQAQYDTVAFIHELEETQQVIYNRQMAIFFANHNTQLDQALQYAEWELEARQDIYAYDTLAWVLYRLGRHDEARAAADRALELGTPDAALYYHAGLIAAAQGDRITARTYLSQALELNPHFDLIQAAAAQEALAGLSNE